MRNRFGKLRRLSTLEESRELYSIESGGQAAQSWKMHGKRLSTWIIVLRSCKSSSRSSSESHEMSEMLERCQTSRYQFTLTWYLLPPPIVAFSHWVFWQTGKVFNRHSMHVQAHRSCGTLVLLWSIGILLRK